MDTDRKIISSIIDRLLKKKEGREEQPHTLIESLDLRAKEVISLVGAGGKTTLMFRLAKELLLAGKRVVTTTTTKILEPSSEETRCLYVHSDEEKLKQLALQHITH